MRPIPKKGLAEYAIGLLTIAIMIGTVALAITWPSTQNLFISSTTSDVKEIRISAYMWEFFPSEIRVKQGDSVSIIMTSLDTTHGLMVNLPDGRMVHGDLNPGKDFRFEFEVDTIGKFPFHCNIYCGIGHDDMRGTIIVEP